MGRVLATHDESCVHKGDWLPWGRSKQGEEDASMAFKILSRQQLTRVLLNGRTWPVSENNLGQPIRRDHDRPVVPARHEQCKNSETISVHVTPTSYDQTADCVSTWFLHLALAVLKLVCEATHICVVYPNHPLDQEDIVRVTSLETSFRPGSRGPYIKSSKRRQNQDGPIHPEKQVCFTTFLWGERKLTKS